MINDLTEWLKEELRVAELEHDGSSEELTRHYWGGYADALNNLLNQYAGPGDTN